MVFLSVIYFSILGLYHDEIRNYYFETEGMVNVVVFVNLFIVINQRREKLLSVSVCVYLCPCTYMYIK